MLTAAHVVTGAVEVTVRRPDKSSMPAVLHDALIGVPVLAAGFVDHELAGLGGAGSAALDDNCGSR
jgi:hypothetical protein